MARIRSIKPEFWSSPNLPADPWARLLFIAMWNHADDNGVGSAGERELLAFAFPNDDQIGLVDLRRMLVEIRRAFGVDFYTVEGRPYYSIPSWEKHQKFDRRSKGKHPGPDQAETMLYQEEQPDSADTRGIPTSTRRDSVAGTGEQGNRGTGEVLAHLGTETTDAHAMIEPACETPPGPKVPIQGWKLVREHTPANLGQSSRSMLAIRVDEMIRSGTPEPDVRACLDLWMTKPEAGPGLLPHLLAEVVKTRDHKPPVEGAATRGANEWIGIANKYGSADTTTELMKELER